MDRILDTLYNRTPLQPLKPESVWNEPLDREIKALADEWLETAGEERRAYVLALQAGLHLWNDSLERSHALSQHVHNATGSYWHGIMHRLEGDYDNAKYWFSKAGSHPIFPELNVLATDYLRHGAELEAMERGKAKAALERMARQAAWDPFRFVDAVEAQVTEGQDVKARTALERIQRLEMALLLRFTCKAATGRTILESVEP